jgi:hypothetical protein
MSWIAPSVAPSIELAIHSEREQATTAAACQLPLHVGPPHGALDLIGLRALPPASGPLCSFTMSLVDLATAGAGIACCWCCFGQRSTPSDSDQHRRDQHQKSISTTQQLQKEVGRAEQDVQSPAALCVFHNYQGRPPVGDSFHGWPVDLTVVTVMVAASRSGAILRALGGHCCRRQARYSPPLRATPMHTHWYTRPGAYALLMELG